MANPQVVSYITENRGRGFQRSDIEAALLAAGWSTQDIADGFQEVDHPGSTSNASSTPAPNVLPQTSAQRESDIELKRLQDQFKKTSIGQEKRSGPGGLTGLLIRTGLVSNEKQANLAMIGIAVLAFGTTFWVLFK